MAPCSRECRLRFALAVTGGLALLLSAAPAFGATQVLGPPTLSTGDGPQGCVGGACSSATIVLASAAAPSVAVAVPDAGTITGWAVEGGVNGTGSIHLRVLRPAANGTLKGAGTSAAATAVNGTPQSTSLPVRKGDLIGVDTDEGASGFAVIDSQSGAGTLDSYIPALPDGTALAPSSSGVAALPEFNATLTFIPPTKTTLKVSGKGKKLAVSGAVSPFDPGVKMTVSLYRKHGKKFRKLSTQKPPLDTSGKFRASFDRPKPGKCKVKARFPGDASYKSSSASQAFSC